MCFEDENSLLNTGERYRHKVQRASEPYHEYMVVKFILYSQYTHSFKMEAVKICLIVLFKYSNKVIRNFLKFEHDCRVNEQYFT